MHLLKNRIEKIKAALREKDLNRAGTLLIHTLASDEIFSYWSDCCDGSERVLKLLKYIHEIRFDEALPTAAVDLLRGDLKIGVQFFLDHIDGPEDVLFILIHERNHLILRRLYPDVLPGADYPPEVFNFAEDAYINAIGRWQVVSTLPERFYHQPGELLLTAKHSAIDWTLFHIGRNGDYNYLKQAHGALYHRNPALLSALGEVIVETGGFSGYRRWMELVSEWYWEKEDEEARKAEMAPSGGTSKSDDQTAPEPSPATRKEAPEGEPVVGVTKDQAGLEDEPQEPGEALDQGGGSEDELEPGKEEPLPGDGESGPAPGCQETKEQTVAILRLATRPRDAEAWDFLTSEIAFVSGLDQSEDNVKIGREAGRLLQYARGVLKEEQPVSNLPQKLIEMVGETTFKSSYRQYMGGSYLEEMVDALSSALKLALDASGTAKAAVDDVIGVDAVPL